jgi:hypothetical protein
MENEGKKGKKKEEKENSDDSEDEKDRDRETNLFPQSPLPKPNGAM